MDAFLKTTKEQLFGWRKPQQARIRISTHALEKMKQWEVAREVVVDTIRNGRHIAGGKVVKDYVDYQVYVIYTYTPKANRYLVLTVWKWFKR